jgi:hypothetical protein
MESGAQIDRLDADPVEYYMFQGVITDPGRHVHLLDSLPSGIGELCLVVQRLLLHIFWAERYGAKLSQERQREVNLRHVSRMMARIGDLDDRPLSEARPLDKRLVGNCRDFSVLLCSMLRHQGVPARARCGFGTYFLPNHYEDHWVCEYWNAAQQRWVMVDAQLDDFQQRALGIDFDPLDVPSDRFITGGKAWQMCRSGGANPDSFGIFDMRGLWFVRGDLVRDLASLNKMELLPWDSWGIMESEDKNLSPDDFALLDRAAALTLEDNVGFLAMRDFYDNEPRLRVPGTIHSYGAGGVQTVHLFA